MIGKEISDYLISLSDKKYLDFTQKLNAKMNLKQLGVRIPLLRNYAKELSKKYELEYLYNNINENFYEEVMLKGFIIGQYKKLDFSELKKYLLDFVPKINDWSICDTFCSGLKITKKYKKEMFELIEYFLKTNKEFQIRFSLVMLLDYYIEEEYIDKIFEIIKSIKNEEYYVKMANAWLISFCMIKYYDKTYEFLKNNKIDLVTHNKAIQKSIESYRLTTKQKEELRKLKRK